MTKKPQVELGRTYIAKSDPRSVWRVDKILSDGIHVALVRVDEPSRRKTISVWALSDHQHFVPADK